MANPWVLKVLIQLLLLPAQPLARASCSLKQGAILKLDLCLRHARPLSESQAARILQDNADASEFQALGFQLSFRSSLIVINDYIESRLRRCRITMNK